MRLALGKVMAFVWFSIQRLESDMQRNEIKHDHKNEM